MIPREKLENIIFELLDKTKANKIPWEEREDEFRRDHYRVLLPNAEIKLYFASPETEPDFVSFLFNRQDGKTVGSLQVNEGDDLWPTAKSLYEEVDRIVTRWDEVLDDVEKYLATK